MRYLNAKAKLRKAIYMKIYLLRVKANGGKKLGTKYGRRITDIPMEEFSKMFMVKENG